MWGTNRFTKTMNAVGMVHILKLLTIQVLIGKSGSSLNPSLKLRFARRHSTLWEYVLPRIKIRGHDVGRA